MLPTDDEFMQLALAQAMLAEKSGEVPVGAVLVQGGKVIASAFNQPIGLCDPTAHAEILTIRAAAKKLNNYRLLDTTLYVTLEPCAMCAMALVHARVGRVVYGAADEKTGAVRSVFSLLTHEHLNHRTHVTSGVMKETCSRQLSNFFRNRRQEKKSRTPQAVQENEKS